MLILKGVKNVLADRKKVQKIKSKRTVKFKPTNNEKVSSKKTVKKETQTIKMSTEWPKSTISSNKRNGSSVKRVPKKNINSSNKNHEVKTIQKRKNIPYSVIRGKKGEIKKKRLVTLCISFILILSFFVFYITSPTGPVERITNGFELFGSGKYPTVLSGTKVLSLQTVNNKFFALTNSHLCGYTYSGKNFILLQHNFSNPVLEVSEERTLVYNRESNKFIIANNSGSVFEENLEESIFCADISYNGSVAFACNSTSYASQICVFNKNLKQYYTWYLADGLVSDIALSNNGKYIALAVLKVKNGLFSTEIYCLDTSKKEPIYTKELIDETVLKIESVSSSNFVYTSNKKVVFLKWKTGETINSNNFGSPTYFSKISKYNLALYGEANRSDIVLFNASGKTKHQFEYNGIIDDISIFDKKIYVLSGNKVEYFDFSNSDKSTVNLDIKSDYILGTKNGLLSFENINLNFVPINKN